ncbi:hypothetical protein CWATWH0402_4267 [Crocosphaera watsonii WH 0402]|uniref:Uncharacterized protein n=2 Tax=Crocosphaera watsonii TaxID=263511 RepID=T2JN77_CROWT|nr:hypothetical protein CWATWH0005_252 [Crocosphaera watsonii WH 0005]CCQ67328.1 hypothetical protein CWATWH0402_4267 [Crocosphaera watsonii WH 0402]
MYLPSGASHFCKKLNSSSLTGRRGDGETGRRGEIHQINYYQ